MIEQVKTLLAERQWQFEQVEEEVIATGFTSSLPDGGDQAFPLYILKVKDAYGDSCLRFSVAPFLDRPPEGYPIDLYLEVGRINHDMLQLKLAIDGNGDLELLQDVPVDRFDRTAFDAAIQLLADYATAHYSCLLALVSE